MPPSQTHYQTLGVDPRATPEQIRRAYRALAKSLHPDVNPSKDAAKRFARIAGAYQTLSNPDKRRAYDRVLAARRAPPGPTGAHVRQAHYTWENIAARKRSKRVDISEIDELYDTFFTKRAPAKPAPKPASASHTQPKTQRKRAS